MTPELISSSTRRAVLGMGHTGRSVARFWKEQGVPFIAMDTRSDLSSNQALKEELDGVETHFGDLNPRLMNQIDLMIASPGIAMDSPAITLAQAQGVEVRGDIDLFVAEAKRPVIGITGSNGKSSVTTFVGQLLTACGKRVAVGGNLGVPALELLNETPDVYVLELSSFQLERAGDLNLAVAIVLNLSPDHLDRHQTMPLYHLAKHRIFAGAKSVVANCRDSLTQPVGKSDVPWVLWRDNEPDLNQLGLREQDGELWLYHGFEPLCACSEIALVGDHNLRNALAALAVCHALGIDYRDLVAGLKTLSGLAHRCEMILEYQHVRYVNDSKGTNVGASIAALEGLSKGKNVILIAGGEGKGQSFKPLSKAIAASCKHTILIGRDADKIEATLEPHVSRERARSMTEAVRRAVEWASEGDVVLLSPACASFDMFIDYQDRGTAFRDAVSLIVQEAEL